MTSTVPFVPPGRGDGSPLYQDIQSLCKVFVQYWLGVILILLSPEVPPLHRREWDTGPRPFLDPRPTATLDPTTEGGLPYSGFLSCHRSRPGRPWVRGDLGSDAQGLRRSSPSGVGSGLPGESTNTLTLSTPSSCLGSVLRAVCVSVYRGDITSPLVCLSAEGLCVGVSRYPFVCVRRFVATYHI